MEPEFAFHFYQTNCLVVILICARGTRRAEAGMRQGPRAALARLARRPALPALFLRGPGGGGSSPAFAPRAPAPPRGPRALLLHRAR